MQGLRLIFVLPDHIPHNGRELAEAQKWMADSLGKSNYHASLKDYARNSFVVPRNYILYINARELFADHTRAAMPVKPATVKPARTAKQTKPAKPTKQTEPTPSVERENGLAPSFKGIPYESIIARWFEMTGGELEVGERNDRLHQLATHLRYITDNDEELLLRIMPRYGLPEDEMKRLIHSACGSEYRMRPKVLRDVLTRFRRLDARSARPWTRTLRASSIPPAMPANCLR